MITYLEAYDGYNGKKFKKLELDDLAFAMMVTLAVDAKKDVDTDDGLQDEMDAAKLPVLFNEALTNFFHGHRTQAIVRAFQKKGYWVGEGDEGSYGFAVDGMVKTLEKQIKKIEAAADARYYGQFR